MQVGYRRIASIDDRAKRQKIRNGDVERVRNVEKARRLYLRLKQQRESKNFFPRVRGGVSTQSELLSLLGLFLSVSRIIVKWRS